MTIELKEAKLMGKNHEYIFKVGKDHDFDRSLHAIDRNGDGIIDEIKSEHYSDEGLSSRQLMEKYRAETQGIVGSFKTELVQELQKYSKYQFSPSSAYTDDEFPEKLCPVTKDPAKQRFYKPSAMQFHSFSEPAMFIHDADNNGTADMVSFAIMKQVGRSFDGPQYHSVQVFISVVGQSTKNGEFECMKVDASRAGALGYLRLFDKFFKKA